MKYFRFTKVVTDVTTLNIIIPDGVETVYYTDTLVGVDIPDSVPFLALQHEECNVTEKTFVEVEEELKSCRMYKDIDEIVKRKIHEKYSLDDEIKMLKLDKESTEYQEYDGYVQSCRAYGRNMKIAKGLRQNGES